MAHRHEKISTLVKEIASSYIGANSGNTSLITITRAEISDDGKNGIIYFTCLPQDKEAAAFGFLKRHRGEIRKELKKRLQTHTIPFLDISIDHGEHMKQRIDQILREDNLHKDDFSEGSIEVTKD
jgi:ribosome-binding factor A